MTKPLTEEEKAAKAENKAQAVKEGDAKAEKAQREEEAKDKKKAKKDDLGGYYHFGINHKARVPFKFFTIGGHNWQRRTHIVYKSSDDETERSPRKGMMLKLPHDTVVAINKELDRDIVRTTPWGEGQRWDPANVEFEPMEGDKSLRDCVFFNKASEEQFKEWKELVTEIMEMAGVLPVETGTEVVTSMQRSANAADRIMDDMRD